MLCTQVRRPGYPQATVVCFLEMNAQSIQNVRECAALVIGLFSRGLAEPWFYNVNNALVAKVVFLKVQVIPKICSSAALLAALVFVMVNLVLHFAGPTEKAKLTLDALGDLNLAKKNGRVASWWISNAYLSEKSPPDVVLIGSSQLGGLQAADADLLKVPQDYALDHKCVIIENYLRGHKIQAKCFSIGIVGSMVSDQFMIEKVLFSAPNKPKVLIATVSPRDLIDGALQSVSSTEVFRFFSPYVSDSSIADDFLCDPIEKATWFTTTGIPVRTAYRNEQRELESAEPVVDKANRPLHRLAQDPLLTTNNETLVNILPGQCTVRPDMPEIFVDNTSDYKKRRYANPRGPMYQRQLTCFIKMLANAKAQGMNVLVVGMPLHISNWSLLPESFWSDYRNRLQTACRDNGATFIELSHDTDFSKKDFVDGVHLSAHGGLKVARRIANAVASTPALVTALRTNTRAQLADAVEH